eukprot:766826-Hanusia_phi.AAC.2
MREGGDTRGGWSLGMARGDLSVSSLPLIPPLSLLLLAHATAGNGESSLPLAALSRVFQVLDAASGGEHREPTEERGETQRGGWVRAGREGGGEGGESGGKFVSQLWSSSWDLAAGSGGLRELGGSLSLHEDPLLASLLHRHTLGGNTPEGLRERSGIVEVVPARRVSGGRGGGLQGEGGRGRRREERRRRRGETMGAEIREVEEGRGKTHSGKALAMASVAALAR